MVEQQTTPRSWCNRRRWKKQEDAVLEIWSRMVSSLSSQTPRSRTTVDGLISTDPRWRHSSSALSLARLAFDPNHIISVLSGFSCSRFRQCLNTGQNSSDRNILRSILACLVVFLQALTFKTPMTKSIARRPRHLPKIRDIHMKEFFSESFYSNTTDIIK